MGPTSCRTHTVARPGPRRTPSPEPPERPGPAGPALPAVLPGLYPPQREGPQRAHSGLAAAMRRSPRNVASFLGGKVRPGAGRDCQSCPPPRGSQNIPGATGALGGDGTGAHCTAPLLPAGAYRSPRGPPRRAASGWSPDSGGPRSAAGPGWLPRSPWRGAGPGAPGLLLSLAGGGGGSGRGSSQPVLLLAEAWPPHAPWGRTDRPLSLSTKPWGPGPCGLVGGRRPGSGARIECRPRKESGVSRAGPLGAANLGSRGRRRLQGAEVTTRHLQPCGRRDG